MLRAFRTLALALVGLVVVAGSLEAQSGTLAGRVTSDQGGGIDQARVVVRLPSGSEVARTETRGDGRYRIGGLPVGAYTVSVTCIGCTEKILTGVQVAAAGGTADFVMTIGAVRIADVEVTTGIGTVSPQKATQAPASVFVVSSAEITERPALTVTDQLRSIPGVDIAQGGLVQSNVVGRGFNNIFSGALLTLIDYRAAAVPSLRVNVPTFFPVTNDDIQQVEFVLGPGAALYGPNASNGVLNIITKSPFNSTGGVISFEAGARAPSVLAVCNDPACKKTSYGRLDDGAGLWRVSGRYATKLGSRAAFKVSGDYLSGTEWRDRDGAEPVTLETSHPELNLPPGTCRDATGCRDFDLERYGGEARLDIRPTGNADTEIIATLGHTNSKRLIEYTGIGAGQARGWKYTTGHLRLRHKRFFVQGFGNFSNAGETFLLRDGNPIRDQSRVWSGQFQHGFDLGARQTFLYGADYFHTDARTENTINGSNEDDDTIKEVGGYVHSITRLLDQLELVAALRVDKHSRLKSAVWSPRAGLVYRPDDDNNFRVTFNRSFSTPTNNNLFLDIPAGQLPPSGDPLYIVRALGVPGSGFKFRVDGGCVGGTDNLCMRTPFAPQLGLLPARASLLWSAAVGGVCATGSVPSSLCALMNSAPPTTQVGTQLRRLNATTRQFLDITPAQVADIEQLKPTITNSIEVGWKGSFGGKVQLSVDGWYERKKNFVGPLIVESPTVFLDRASTIAYLTGLFTQAGVPNAAATAAQVGTGMAGVEAATSLATTGVPLGTVVPTNTPLTERPDIFLTYRNFGEVDLYGADLAFDVVATTNISFSGSLSLVSDDFFAAAEVNGPTDLALNAPKAKGSFTGAWRDELGRWGVELRFRAVKGFPVNSGVYVSNPDPENPGNLLAINDYGIFDVQGNWKPPIGPRNILLAASIQNLLDKKHVTFVGFPTLRRMLLTKISYTF